MENVLKYQQIITALLQEYAADWRNGRIEVQVVSDTAGHHYQLVLVGWDGGRYVHNTPLHLDIKGGKVWVQQNLTEEYVAEELVRRGIPPTDIVLGVQPPAYRKFTDYAAA